MGILLAWDSSCVKVSVQLVHPRVIKGTLTVNKYDCKLVALYAPANLVVEKVDFWKNITPLDDREIVFGDFNKSHLRL